jgi:hypothetical protein
VLEVDEPVEEFIQTKLFHFIFDAEQNVKLFKLGNKFTTQELLVEQNFAT